MNIDRIIGDPNKLGDETFFAVWKAREGEIKGLRIQKRLKVDRCLFSAPSQKQLKKAKVKDSPDY